LTLGFVKGTKGYVKKAGFLIPRLIRVIDII
jgi:hypothetical protein